jgi:hypothetical protein
MLTTAVEIMNVINEMYAAYEADNKTPSELRQEYDAIYTEFAIKRTGDLNERACESSAAHQALLDHHNEIRQLNKLLQTRLPSFIQILRSKKDKSEDAAQMYYTKKDKYEKYMSILEKVRLEQLERQKRKIEQEKDSIDETIKYLDYVVKANQDDIRRLKRRKVMIDAEARNLTVTAVPVTRT